MYRSSPRLRRHARGDILFGPMFFIGFMAAIALPAYQDYVTRSQVFEGLNLASAAKLTVAEFYATNGRWPANNKEAGFIAAPAGKYTRSVTINQGTVTIRYGVQANASIAGHSLTLRPVVSQREDVIWSCGFGEVMGGSDPGSGAAAPHKTNLAPKYLPKACRGS